MTTAAPWLLELARTLPGLFASYGPSAPLDPRTRERIIVAISSVEGSRSTAWVHGSWQQFLGDVDSSDDDAALIEYAIACAESGGPLLIDELQAALPPTVMSAVRATVAHGALASLVGRRVDDLAARVTGRRRLGALALARDVAAVTITAPITAPLLGAAAAMRVIDRVAPPLPAVRTPPAGEANLLVDLLSAAVPSYLANAAVRLVALGGPVTLTIGVRAGRTSATVRIGRGKVSIENGIAGDAVVVVEGEIEPLLEVATGSLVRELRGVRIRGT